jgi:hypothetical protein
MLQFGGFNMSAVGGLASIESSVTEQYLGLVILLQVKCYMLLLC